MLSLKFRRRTAIGFTLVPIVLGILGMITGNGGFFVSSSGIAVGILLSITFGSGLELYRRD